MRLKIILLQRLMSKILSKYIASFDYCDRSLIVLSVTGGSISIASFETVIGTPVGIAEPTGLVKKLLKITRNKKRSII